MKKNETILKTVFLFLFAVFLLQGCRNEIDNINSQKEFEQNLSDKNRSKISFRSFRNETKLKSISPFLKIRGKDYKTGKGNTVVGVYKIDTININKLDFNKNKTYTFRAYHLFENPNNVYNVVYFCKNGAWEYSIIKLLENNKNLPIYDSRYGIIKNFTNSNTSRTCTMAYTTYDYHCTQTGQCASGICDGCILCITITSGTVAYECGSGSSDGGNTGNGGNDTGGSGGGPTSTMPDPSGYVFDPNQQPSIDAEYVRASHAYSFWLQLDDNNKSWVYGGNQGTYSLILEDYLNKYSTNNNTNNLNFHNWALMFLIENPNTSIEQFIPMLNFAQDFLSKNPDTINPEQIFNRLKLLDDLSKTNSDILLDIPCSQLPYWKDLANHQIPQQVKDKLKTVNSNTHWYNSDLEIQNLDYSKSYTINMDVYPIKISTLPNKPGTNQKFTPAEFFNYFRLNINNFTDVNHGKFYPVVDSNIGVNDTNLWSSSSPLGSLVTIKIPLDEGTVICSGYNSQAWIFTTVKSPWDGEHPVSGNRLFGYYMDGNDMYIYTRGIDRFTSTYSTPEVIRELENLGYSKASDMWKNMQTLLSNFVNSNNGTSQVIPGVDYVPNYIFVKEYLKGQRSINSLGCH